MFLGGVGYNYSHCSITSDFISKNQIDSSQTEVRVLFVYLSHERKIDKY